MQAFEAVLDQAPVAQAGELRAYQGGYFRVLVAPAQTYNAFALLEFTLPRGAEPPRHLHTREDETFYVLEGSIDFHVGEEVVHAQAGGVVFGPRNVAHRFAITSPQARMLTLITPGSFTDFFMGQSQPAAATGPLTPPQGPPPTAVIEHMTHLLREEHGVLFGL